MRAESTQSREQIQMEGLGDSGKEHESQLCLGSGVFTDDCGLGHVASQAPRNWSEQGQGQGVITSHSFPRARGSRCQDVQRQWSGIGVWACRPRLVIPGVLSVVLEGSREIINSLPLTRRTYIKACVGWGCRSSREQKQEWEQKADFYGLPQFPCPTRGWQILCPHLQGCADG